SSRRRHTRSTRDWSSDVCSSDLGSALPGKSFGLEHQAQTHARAERLLEEIVVHSGGRERQFEVLVGHTKPLIGVLINQRLCFSVGNVESVKPKLEADPIIELPRVLQVSIDAGRGGDRKSV